MESVTQFIRKIFSGVDTAYLIKSYFVSFVFLAVCLWAMNGQEAGLYMYTYVFVSFLLFPFSSILWDDLINTIMDGNTFILPIYFFVVWKIIKVTILYGFAVFIAPIGLIYVYVSNGFHKAD